MSNINIEYEKNKSHHSSQYELAKPLEAGEIYNVSFSISLAEKSAYATQVGVYFSPTQLQIKSNEEIYMYPNLASTDVIYKKKGWQQIRGKYTARGG